MATCPHKWQTITYSMSSHHTMCHSRIHHQMHYIWTVVMSPYPVTTIMIPLDIHIIGSPSSLQCSHSQYHNILPCSHGLHSNWHVQLYQQWWITSTTISIGTTKLYHQSHHHVPQQPPTWQPTPLPSGHPNNKNDRNNRATAHPNYGQQHNKVLNTMMIGLDDFIMNVLGQQQET